MAYGSKYDVHVRSPTTYLSSIKGQIKGRFWYPRAIWQATYSAVQ